MGTTFRAVSAAALWVSLAGSCAAADSARLVDVLQARAKAVVSFRAEVSVVERPGRGRARVPELFEGEARFLRETLDEPELADETIRQAQNWRRVAVLEPITTRHRYFALEPYRVRFEDYVVAESGRGYEKERQLRTYTGQRWEVFSPASITARAQHTTAEMNVFAGNRNIQPKLEVARGAAVPTNWMLRGMVEKKLLPLSASAMATGQIAMADLLALTAAPGQRRELALTLPGGGDPLPVLELATEPWEDTGLGLFRVRIWFDPEQDWFPVRMECECLTRHPQTNECYYLLSDVVTWEQSQWHSSGVRLPTRCTLAEYSPFRVPVDGEPREKWPQESLELNLREVVFSNVSINEALEPDLFRVNPPPGTNVVDDTAGYRYLVGNSGEELEKSALALREEVPPAGGSAGAPKLLIVGPAVLGAVLLGLLIWSIRRSRPARGG